MKLTLSVRLADGETYQVTTNLFVIISWERKFKRRASDLSSGIGMEDLAFMAYEASKQQGHPVPISFDEFVKKLEDLEVVETASASPYQGGFRRQLAALLVETGFWPPTITFETDDLATCVQIINEQRRKK